MPRIPDNWLGKRLSTKIKELKTNKMQLLTIMMALVVFVVCSLEIASFFLPNYVCEFDYETFYYPLITSLELLVFSLFFTFKAFRYTSCIDTKITSLLLPFVYLVSIIALILKMKVVYYLLILQPIILVVVALLTLINIIKWLLKQ